MDELTGVKNELKKWEFAFFSNHGRRPSKEDIETAGDEVISLYKKYDKIKRAQNSIPVWGKELNKDITTLKDPKPINENTEPVFRMSISKKFNETVQAPKTLKVKKPFSQLNIEEERNNTNENEISMFTEVVPTPRSNIKIKSNFFDGSKKPPSQKFNSPLLAIHRSGLKNDFLTALPLTSETGFQNTVDSPTVQLKTSDFRSSTSLNEEIFEEQDMPAKGAKDSIDVAPWSIKAFTSSKPLEEQMEFQQSVKDDANSAARSSKARTKRKRKEDDDDDNGGGDVDLSAKKIRLAEEDVIVDRNTEDIQNDVLSTEVTTKWRTPKEYSTKMSSDNFVRLNMKVKKYKKKGGVSAVAIRKQIWRQKLMMKFGNSGGGKTGNCFKCGQPGHWSKNCKNKASTMKDFDWTMGSQNNQVEHPENVEVQRIDIGQSASRALEKVSFLGNVVHERFEPKQCLLQMEPMFELEEDGSVPDTPSSVMSALRKFGFTSFREGQKEAVMNILCGKSTLVILSTGTGKSLCYQLPAYLYAQRSNSICLVVSPLVSLMQDQVLDLPACLKGACIHNNMTAEQRQKVLESAADNQLHFLLLSPEMLVGGLFSGEGRVPNLPPISFACIDEVHCLADWSHHFRPSYLMICKVLRERFGVKCFLGLTATANISTVDSVCQHFDIANDESSIIRQAPVPRNLMVTISRDDDKEEMLIQLLKGKRFSKCQSIIVYCTRREQTTRVATLIRTRMQYEVLNDDDVAVEDDAIDDIDAAKSTKRKSKKIKKKKPKALLKWDAECYHAGLTAVQRRRIQKNFMSGKLRVVVATVAFGMGLDKSDVRGVIHYNIPGTVESYIQEIGRAGRDGILSHCHLFLDATSNDLMELKRHIHAKGLDRITVKKLVQQVFKPCRCRTLHEIASETSDIAEENTITTENSTNDLPRSQRICPGHERSLSIEPLVKSLDVKEEGLSTLLCYLELCPQKWINNRHPVYSRCCIKFYSAPEEFSDILKKCPVLGILLSQRKELLASLSTGRSIEFDVIELSDSIGSQSGQVKRQLKDLQFISDETGCRRSGVLVEFSDLAFHFHAPGDLMDEEIDQVVDYLYERVHSQECAELYHLQKFYEMLKSVSYKSCYSCQDEVDEERSFNLRSKLQKYLESSKDLISSEELKELHADQMDPTAEASLRSDIRSFINTYSKDHRITGRSIARVFHGIHSPCFPSEIWSKVRRYWRSHIGVDFNELRRIATTELTNR